MMNIHMSINEFQFEKKDSQPSTNKKLIMKYKEKEMVLFVFVTKKNVSK